LDDVACLSRLDRALACAVKLWNQRPAPIQRAVRAELGDAMWDLWSSMGEESFKLLLPEAYKVCRDVMRNFFSGKTHAHDGLFS